VLHVALCQDCMVQPHRPLHMLSQLLLPICQNGT